MTGGRPGPVVPSRSAATTGGTGQVTPADGQLWPVARRNSAGGLVQGRLGAVGDYRGPDDALGTVLELLLHGVEKCGLLDQVDRARRQVPGGGEQGLVADGVAAVAVTPQLWLGMPGG